MGGEISGFAADRASSCEATTTLRARGVKRLNPCSASRSDAAPFATKRFWPPASDAHAPADVGPRRAGAAGLVDEVADQVVRDLAEVLGGQDGVAELVEGVVVDRGDRRDEVVQAYGGRRWSFVMPSTMG